MRRTARTVRLSLTLAACTAGAVLASAGAASGGSGDPARVGGARALVEVAEARVPADDTRAYWTPARMAAAVPVEETRPLAAGGAGIAIGGEGDRASLGSGAVASPAAEPGPAFTRYEVTDTSAVPARTHGKVFFRMGGSNYVCSGTAVSGETDTVVISAGHCVHDEAAGWATRWEFVPGYRVDGSGNPVAPFGEFAAEELVSIPGWVDDGNFAYDVSAALLGTNAAGQTLREALGGAARGIAFGRPRHQDYDAFGYPAAPPFDGDRLYVCDSSYAGDDPYASADGPAPMAIGCDMTGGSSGGGWIIAGGYVNSVNSFGYEGIDDTMFGPYFGAAVRAMYEGVCCRTIESAPPAPEPAPAPQPEPAPAPQPAPVPAAQNTYTLYAACGLGAAARPARKCRRRARKGAFFRSELADVAYRLCVRFPTGRRTCTAPKPAQAGALYVNRVATTTSGSHKLTWWSGGKRVGLRYLWVRPR